MRRLRIAVFTHEFPALSETFVLNQVTGLLDLGHDVLICANAARDEPMVHPDVVAYGLPERTVHLDVPQHPVRRIMAAIGLAWRHFRGRPATLLRYLDVRRHGRFATSLRLLFWGARLDDQPPFDVILAHFGPLGQTAAALREAGAISGRLATVMHGVDVSAYVRDAPDTYDELFRVGELFLPISEVWKEKLLTLGCDSSRIAVHHMGVQTDRYRFRARRYEPGQALRLLTVGRLMEKKGVADALRAVAQLVRRGIPVSYLIVGDGPLREELETLASELGIADRVGFLGWQNQAAVATLMNTADVLLAPSVTSSDGDQEGIPVTLMEAMASGMLVVSTWHSGIPELVEDGRSGLLVPEGDDEALAAALAGLAHGRPDWAAVSQAARARVEEAFDVRKLNRHLVERFAALLDEMSTGAAAPPSLVTSAEDDTPALTRRRAG
jgi:colanic acid/amylovoran biosynthesis glycosyltransferase